MRVLRRFFGAIFWIPYMFVLIFLVPITFFFAVIIGAIRWVTTGKDGADFIKAVLTPILESPSKLINY